MSFAARPFYSNLCHEKTDLSSNSIIAYIRGVQEKRAAYCARQTEPNRSAKNNIDAHGPDS